MPSANDLAAVVRHLPAGAGPDPTDADLLARYTRTGDGDAFAAVVRRYGGLVLGTARRQLADSHTADDVYQATFLALARAAGRLGTRTPLAGWLYTVALRQARKARGRDARREAAERAVPVAEAGTDPLDQITGRELVRAVDEELTRLPERLRLPVLLCGVQGLSREDAARRLGWSAGAVKGRLERGRRRLAARLEARGLAPSAILLAPAAAAIVPADLVARTVELAAEPWSAAVPPAVAVLAAAGPARRLVPVALVAGFVAAAGLTGWALAAGGKPPAEPRHQPAPPPAAPPAPVTANVVVEDVPLPEGAVLRLGTPLFRHGITIMYMSVSADGKRAVAASGNRANGDVKAFDLTTGKVQYTLDEKGTYIEAVALSPDGKTLATKRRHAVQFRDAATGQEQASVAYPTANPSTLTDWIAWSPDGARVAVAGAEAKNVHLIDRAKGEVVKTFVHSNVVFAGAFSPDGKWLAAGGYDQDKTGYFVRLWDVETGKELRRFRSGGGVRCLTFSPDGGTLAIGGDSGRTVAVRLYDPATGTERRSIPYPDASRIVSVTFSPDGKTLAAAGGTTTRLFDPATGREKLKIDGKGIDLRFTPDGKVIVGAVSGAIYKWDAATGKPLTPGGGDSSVGQVEVTADGKRVVTRGVDGDAHVWDAKTGAHLKRFTVAWQRGIGVSPDGKYVVWPVEDEKVKYTPPGEPRMIYTGHRLRMYDLDAEKVIDRFAPFDGDAHDLTFTADGAALVTVDYNDGAVRFWDVATGKQTRSFRAVRDDEKAQRHYYVWRSRLSPDGSVLAVTYQRADNTTALLGKYAVRLWDTATGKELRELDGHWYYVEAVVFTPDGKYLVTGCPPLGDFLRNRAGGSGNQLFAWEVATGKQVAELADGATAAAFSPDGKFLAATLADGSVRIWEVAGWKPFGEFRGPREKVTALTYGPDGRLYAGGLDATVLVWDPKAALPPRDGQ
jgi:RNA polymerase sigma factor (sigma-70 family)